VDVSSRFQELHRRPGLINWRPTVGRSCERTFESYEELLASSMDDHLKMKLTEGHFPPRDVEPFNLHRWFVHFILAWRISSFAAFEYIPICRILVVFLLPFCRRCNKQSTRKMREYWNELDISRDRDSLQ